MNRLEGPKYKRHISRCSFERENTRQDPESPRVAAAAGAARHAARPAAPLQRHRGALRHQQDERAQRRHDQSFFGMLT